MVGFKYYDKAVIDSKYIKNKFKHVYTLLAQQTVNDNIVAETYLQFCHRNIEAATHFLE